MCVHCIVGYNTVRLPPTAATTKAQAMALYVASGFRWNCRPIIMYDCNVEFNASCAHQCLVWLLIKWALRNYNTKQYSLYGQNAQRHNIGTQTGGNAQISSKVFSVWMLAWARCSSWVLRVNVRRGSKLDEHTQNMHSFRQQTHTHTHSHTNSRKTSRARFRIENNAHRPSISNNWKQIYNSCVGNKFTTTRPLLHVVDPHHLSVPPFSARDANNISIFRIISLHMLCTACLSSCARHVWNGGATARAELLYMVYIYTVCTDYATGVYIYGKT